MHSVSKILAYSDNNIAENCLSSVRIDLYAYNILVLYAPLFSGFGNKVDVTLCNDNALADFDLALRTCYLAAGCACNIARFSYEYRTSDRTCVRSGKFNLCSRTYRA